METAQGGMDREALTAAIGAVWREVLQADDLSPDTNFFEFGGHSVTAMRMMIRVRNDLGMALPTRLIFDNPRLADFVAAVHSEQRGAG